MGAPNYFMVYRFMEVKGERSQEDLARICSSYCLNMVKSTKVIRGEWVKEVLMFLLQGIPEVTGLVALSLVMAQVPLSWTRALAVGTGLALIMLTVRALGFTVGFHTLAGMALLTVYLARVYRVSTVRSFAAAFSAFLVLALLELFCTRLVFAVLGLNGQVIAFDPVLWKLVGLPQAILMLLLAWLLSQYLKPRVEVVQDELPAL